MSTSLHMHTSINHQVTDKLKSLAYFYVYIFKFIRIERHLFWYIIYNLGVTNGEGTYYKLAYSFKYVKNAIFKGLTSL